MKKRKISALASVLLLISVTVLASCRIFVCNHVIAIDAYVAPTCTDSGLTEGKHCSVCGEIFAVQEQIAATGHRWGEWEIIEKATHEKQGKRAHTCTVCEYVEYKEINAVTNDGRMGSAGKLSDTTLIVSIFASDLGTNWNMDSATDRETASLMRENLSVAVEWIEEQCAAYGVDSEFVFDWVSYPELYYTFDFAETNMVRDDGNGYYIQRSYIESYINSEELKQKHNAQNIIYILYFNTNETNTVNSWALTSLQTCDVELINVFVRDDIKSGYYFMSPSGFAHEILHCFGAHDLYYASETVSQEYVDHCADIKSKDIMFTVSSGKDIYHEFSELDAYYVGLTDSSADAETWNLGKSSHFWEE